MAAPRLDPDLAEFLTSRDKPRPCKFSLVADELSDGDRRKLDKALDQRGISEQTVLSWLEARSKHVATVTIYRHRRKQCMCYRGTL